MNGAALLGRLGGASAPSAEAAEPARAHPSRDPYVSVRVVGSIAEAADAWSHLERIAEASPYQQLRWIEAWMETEGRAAGLQPCIVIGYGATGEPVVLLPFGVARTRLLRRAMFLGGKHTNYNMGLYDPRFPWSAADAERLLRLAARQRLIDVFELTTQPLAWAGVDNPLAHLPRAQPSPSSCHSATLHPDGEAHMRANQSSAARKKLRSKANALQALGPVTHRVARTDAEIHAVVEAHLRQKAAKLASLGVPVPDTDSTRRVFERAAGIGGDASLELNALYCGERIVATFGGLGHGSRFSGTLISYEVDAPFARTSPGELLLNAVIRAKCAEGFASFDLGVGEARYKDSYCPIEEPLVDSFLALTLLGRLAAQGAAARLRLKTSIKRSPRLWAAAQAARRLRARMRRSPAG